MLDGGVEVSVDPQRFHDIFCADVPEPSDDPALRHDEDPLEPGDLDLGLAPRVEAEE